MQVPSQLREWWLRGSSRLFQVQMSTWTGRHQMRSNRNVHRYSFLLFRPFPSLFLALITHICPLLWPFFTPVHLELPLVDTRRKASNDHRRMHAQHLTFRNTLLSVRMAIDKAKWRDDQLLIDHKLLLAGCGGEILVTGLWQTLTNSKIGECYWKLYVSEHKEGRMM